MKLSRWFVSIILIFFICVSNVFAQMTPEEEVELLTEVNSVQNSEEMCAIIESGKLDTLGKELLKYTGGCSDTSRTAYFIMNRNFQNVYELAENYVFSCIVNRSHWGFVKEYCDNGLLLNMCALDEGLYQKLNSDSQTMVVKEALNRGYNSIEDFRNAFYNAVKMLQVSGGGGGSGSSAPRSEAILLDKDGLPAETAAEVSKLRYLGWSFSGALITVVYDSLGGMKSLNVTDYDCENTYADIPIKTTDGDYVKAMLWDSLDEMSPRTEFITINPAENKNRVEYTECSVVSAGNTHIDVMTDDGNTNHFLALSGGMYRYLGHRVGITSVGSYILDIKDVQSYDTVTLRCNDIDTASLSSISTGKVNYPISSAAKFFDCGRETQFYIPDEPFEIILSKPADSDTWDTINILDYKSGVVEYIGDGSYIENGGIYTEDGAKLELRKYLEVASDCEIKIGSVVSYCDFKVYISNETVYGKAEFTDDKVKIGEKTFHMYNTVDVDTDYDMYTAYLDAFGNVVKLVPDKSVYDTCIITKVYNDGEKTYADIVGGERILIDGEVIYCGLRIMPEILPSAAASGLLYAKILDSDEKKVIITEGEIMQMEYSDGTLSSKQAIAERGTPMCLFSEEKYMPCVLEKGILNNHSKYQCTVFFDEDNRINPVYVCVNTTSEKIIIITDVDTENGIISGYCDGKYVTYKCSYANSDDIFNCVRAKCIGDEIISYISCGLIGSGAVGRVIQKGSGYIVCGNPEEYEIIRMSDDVSIYLYDGNSLIPSDFSDIIADSNDFGYGSYVRYMYRSGNDAKIIVLDN